MFVYLLLADEVSETERVHTVRNASDKRLSVFVKFFFKLRFCVYTVPRKRVVSLPVSVLPCAHVFTR